MPISPSAASLSVPSPAATTTTSTPSATACAASARASSRDVRADGVDIVARARAASRSVVPTVVGHRRRDRVHDQADPHGGHITSRERPVRSAADGSCSRSRRRLGAAAVTAEIVECRACPRLVAWREQVAREKRASFRDEDYWGRPVPGFGDPGARVLDPRARAGGARRQPHRPGVHRRPVGRLAVRRAAPRGLREPAGLGAGATTGCVLADAYVAAAVRCAPPANKPTPEERDTCLPFLRARARCARPAVGDRRARRLRATTRLWQVLAARGRRAARRPRPKFGHGVEVARRAATRSSAATTRASRTRSPGGSPSPCSTRCLAGPRARHLKRRAATCRAVSRSTRPARR